METIKEKLKRIAKKIKNGDNISMILAIIFISGILLGVLIPIIIICTLLYVVIFIIKEIFYIVIGTFYRLITTGKL